MVLTTKSLTVSGIRCFHQATTASADYEVAIEALNSLQSNASVLEERRKTRLICPQENVKQTERYLNKIGIKVEDLDKLNVIHVSGTKGKGSTSAYCENLLRNHGYTTGFFSSPHLVAVRERIRLNGKPISEEKFAGHFWKIYNDLVAKKESDGDMPAYFKFLTVMAYYVFLEEKVDAAIVEVGIGGQYDCTNVIRNPVVCGVTSLGLDHINMLGSTIDKIAWQKSGIFKPNVPAFTVKQPQEAIEILFDRANDIKCPLHVVPSLELHIDENMLSCLNFSSPIQYINAALAMQLVHTWLNHQKLGEHEEIGDGCIATPDLIKFAPPLSLNENTIKGLRDLYWPGRCQVLIKDSIHYFLDGAHTKESIEVCIKWFETVSKIQEKKTNRPVFRLLVFNIFGDRKAENILPALVNSKFDLVTFCPNFAHVSINAASDQNAVSSSWEAQMERCTHNSHVWMHLADEKQQNESQNKPNSIKTVVFPSICDVTKWLTHTRNYEKGISNGVEPDVVIPMLKCEKLFAAAEVHVLVTGSLHLVGGFLSILDPHLTESYK
uniref:Folylpolyglutamate synthase n=1 Tax=Strigamia maritima TaxID=126957 RepID=T1JI53_STRMM